MVYTVKVIQMSKRCNQIEHHFYTIFLLIEIPFRI